MRYVFSLFAYALLLVMLSMISQAQTIPNGGMESWSAGDPVGWNTTNDPGPPAIANVTQSNQPHGGASAAQGTVINVSGFAFPAVLLAGPDGEGFPISARPAALRGWYKFTSVGGDILQITSGFIKGDSVIGGGSFVASASTATYREFSANTIWVTGNIPDTAVIVVQISGGGGVWHAGSTFWVDDFVYGPPLDVREDKEGIPNNFSLRQNYPNPFNPSTKIRYEIPADSRVTLSVFNLIGQEVASLVDGDRSPGVYVADFDAANLASGTYFYRLRARPTDGGQAGNFATVKRLMVVK